MESIAISPSPLCGLSFSSILLSIPRWRQYLPGHVGRQSSVLTLLLGSAQSWHLRMLNTFVMWIDEKYHQFYPTIWLIYSAGDKSCILPFKLIVKRAQFIQWLTPQSLAEHWMVNSGTSLIIDWTCDHNCPSYHLLGKIFIFAFPKTQVFGLWQPPLFL